MNEPRVCPLCSSIHDRFESIGEGMQYSPVIQAGMTLFLKGGYSSYEEALTMMVLHLASENEYLAMNLVQCKQREKAVSGILGWEKTNS